MAFRTLFTVMFLTMTIEESLQICKQLNASKFFNQFAGSPPFVDDYYYRPRLGYRYHPRYITKYIHCEEEPLSSSFHVKVDPLMDGTVEWLEINNTHSPEIASGALKGDLETLTDLRINGVNVEIIEPGAFEGLIGLKKLSLKNNLIYSLPQYCFGNLTNLITLDLSYNALVVIDKDTFMGINILERLFLQNNDINSLPNDLFKNLTSLKFLDISYNKIASLNEEIFRELKNLTGLWINDNLIEHISPKTFNMPNLVDLYVHRNFIHTFVNLSLPRILNVFNISDNRISKFNFKTFTQITALNLSSNDMITLNSNTFSNMDVKEIYLGHNSLGLETIKTGIFNNLTRLEVISLEDNKIYELDTGLFKNNRKLKILNLSQNYLTQFNSQNLTDSLRQLNLSSNNFLNFPNVSTLTNLTKLDVSFNGLNEISFHSVENLSALTSLLLQNNRISQMSLGCFRNLKSLWELNLSNNNIFKLNIGIFVGINQLIYLDISHNQLQEISEGAFHNLRMMQQLNVGYNNLSFFSVENTIGHLNWLKEINLQGNNWPCKFLINFIKEYKVSLKEGSDNNVTNVNGIACKNLKEDDLGNKDVTQMYVKSLEEATRLQNSTNVLLVFILIVLLLQLVLKGFSRFKLGRFMKNDTEEEIQLVENEVV